MHNLKKKLLLINVLFQARLWRAYYVYIKRHKLIQRNRFIVCYLNYFYCLSKGLFFFFNLYCKNVGNVYNEFSHTSSDCSDSRHVLAFSWECGVVNSNSIRRPFTRLTFIIDVRVAFTGRAFVGRYRPTLESLQGEVLTTLRTPFGPVDPAGGSNK